MENSNQQIDFNVSLANDKLTTYSEVIEVIINDRTGEIKNKLSFINGSVIDKFISKLKPHTKLRVDFHVIKKFPSGRKRRFLHGGVFSELSKHMGEIDIDDIKKSFKRKFLKVEFKKDLDGNIILDKETNLPIPKENQFFTLTPDQIKLYYRYYIWGMEDECLYHTSDLSDDAYRRLITTIIEFVRDHFGLHLNVKYI